VSGLFLPYVLPCGYVTDYPSYREVAVSEQTDTEFTLTSDLSVSAGQYW
jgi:hypothetical protein